MTEAHYQATMRTIQIEQDLVAKELRAIKRQQEELFYLDQEEKRLYSEVAAICAPEERVYFQEKGLDSLAYSKKGQEALSDKEAALSKTKKQLLEAEETCQRERQSLFEQ